MVRAQAGGGCKCDPGCFEGWSVLPQVWRFWFRACHRQTPPGKPQLCTFPYLEQFSPLLYTGNFKLNSATCRNLLAAVFTVTGHWFA